MTNFQNYHSYLQDVSIVGTFYRKYILYPFLRLITGPIFLDVGCGIGLFLSFGSKDSLGIDVNPFNIDTLQRNGLNARLIPASGIFPVDDESFNSIICDQVLEHIDNPTIFLRELDRVLVSGGKLVIGVPQKKGYRKDPDHKIFYSIAKLRNLSSTYNLSFSYKTHFYFPFPFAFFGNFVSSNYLYVIFKKL